jgi:Na+(H+)/acetate symporter ActP
MVGALLAIIAAYRGCRATARHLAARQSIASGFPSLAGGLLGVGVLVSFLVSVAPIMG